MSRESSKNSPDGPKRKVGEADDRQARRAAALRENLRKRKNQQRARAEKPGQK